MNLKRCLDVSPQRSISSCSDNDIITEPNHNYVKNNQTYSQNSKHLVNNYGQNAYTSTYDSFEDDDFPDSYQNVGRSYNSYGSYSSGKNQLFQNPIPQSGMLVLTEEEKRTLVAEGYPVPARLPLTKLEERNLKKIRRKIKNKISAQESRRKKKEYLESLEKKVDSYGMENSELKRRVDGLESTNRSLLSQLRHLQQLLMKTNNNNGSSSGKQSVTSTISGSKASHHHVVFGSSRNSSSSLRARDSNSAAVQHTSVVSAAALNGTSASSEVGSGGASASTCLMMFVLCFAVLLAGQPVPSDPVDEHGMQQPAQGQSAGGIFSDLASWNQIGYTWNRDANEKKRRQNSERKDKASKAWNITKAGEANGYSSRDIVQTFDEAMERVIQRNSGEFVGVDDEKAFLPSPVVNKAVEKNGEMRKYAGGSLLSGSKLANKAIAAYPRRKRPWTVETKQRSSNTESRSRILGSLNELEEYNDNCDAVGRNTLWSYMFDTTPEKRNSNEVPAAAPLAGNASVERSPIRIATSTQSSSLGASSERKRKIIKIYTQDEAIFKQHHPTLGGDVNKTTEQRFGRSPPVIVRGDLHARPIVVEASSFVN